MGGRSELLHTFCSQQFPDGCIEVRPCMLATFVLPNSAPTTPIHLLCWCNVRCNSFHKRSQALDGQSKVDVCATYAHAGAGVWGGARTKWCTYQVEMQACTQGVNDRKASGKASGV